MTHDPAMTLGPMIAGVGAALIGVAAPVGAAPLTAQEVCSEFAADPTQSQFLMLTGQIMGQLALTPQQAGQTFGAMIRNTCPAEIPAAAAMLTAHAYPGDPPGANCETVPLGALYCDGPVQPTGGWTRCVETPIFQCYHRDPAAPPVKIGEPDHHIGDGL